MSVPIVLASASPVRRSLLERGGLTFSVFPVRVDEEAIRQSMIAEGYAPRDLADALADAKAARAHGSVPDGLTIGADQILVCNGQVLAKPETKDAAFAQIKTLAGQTHSLLSAAVIYEDGRPVWRHIGRADLKMWPMGDADINTYLAHAWPEIRGSLGGYHLEGDGVRLFDRITGDYFSILGLPLIELLTYLRVRGVLHA